MVQEGSPDRVSRPSGHPAALGCLVGAAWPSLGGVLGGFWGSWWPSGTGFIFFHGLLGASWGRPAAVLDPLGPSPDRFGEVLEALGARRRRQKQMAGRNEKCTFYHCKTNDFQGGGPSGKGPGQPLEPPLAIPEGIDRVLRASRVASTASWVILTRLGRPWGRLGALLGAS